jgi:opine dehydrogenase
MSRIVELFSGAQRCADALDAALGNVGPMLHPPWVVASAAAIDQGRFDARAAAKTTTAQRLVEALDRERVATRHGWGYSAPHGDLTVDDDARSAEGEAIDFEHRYVVEDVALGLSLLESAARTVNVESPATTGLLLLFGTLLRRPLSGRGRALEAIGLGDLLRREIRELLQDGWLAPVWKQAIR